MYDFITDLDAFFCERYAGYDKLCVLKGYKMPLMQRSEMVNGKMRAYTLPANTMRLALQENRDELLAQLKKGISDKTLSFTFYTVGFFQRLRRAKTYRANHDIFLSILQKYHLNQEQVDGVDVQPAVWEKIRKGKFMPSKNLIFSLALVAHFTFEDTQTLLQAFGYAFDYTLEKDVVVSYLLEQKIFNPNMMQAAFQEYKIQHLFLL